jgi:hypothetical protein
MFCLLPSIQRGAPRGDRGEVCSYIIPIWRSCFDFSRSSLALHRPHCVETTAECGGTCPRNEIWKPLSDFGVALACVIRRRMRALLPESAIRIMNQHGTITRINNLYKYPRNWITPIRIPATAKAFAVGRCSGHASCRFFIAA